MRSALRTGHTSRSRVTAGAASRSAPVAARLAMLVLAASALATGAVSAVELPKGAVPLSAVELLSLYGGKTWKWGEGGAYFEREGRQFRARTVDDAGVASVTSGTWKITDGGKLCFSATWGSADGTQYETCFGHAAAGGDLYQRRLPDGEWYVFRHAEPQPDDEYGNLVRGDRVSDAQITE